MVEANLPDAGRHIVKKANLPAIDESITLDKTKFDRTEVLMSIKVPVHQIQEFSKKVS